jgi:hypothetical protein
MELKAFLAAGLAILAAAPAAAQPGNPSNPGDFIRNPHPAMPWAPNNPDRFLSETYGTVVQYIAVPPQPVVIQVPAPPAEGVPSETRDGAGAPAPTRDQAGVPTQTREQPGVPAPTREQTGAPAETRAEAGVPAQTRGQVVEIPGYYITETTTGYWYPERWTLEQVNGVYQWVKLPAEFRRK